MNLWIKEWLIKPKHGVLSEAYKQTKDKNAAKIFYINIDGAGIKKPIEYRIIYMDLKYFDIKTAKLI